MRHTVVVRQFVLVAVALAAGWALHGVALQHVHAGERNDANRSSDAEGGLAFQLSGLGPQTALTVWNPHNQNLYIYAGALMGNSQVNCTYSLHMEHAGAPIQRQNCPIGSIGNSR